MIDVLVISISFIFITLGFRNALTSRLENRNRMLPP
jgi:hypothetical protein